MPKAIARCFFAVPLRCRSAEHGVGSFARFDRRGERPRGSRSLGSHRIMDAIRRSDRLGLKDGRGEIFYFGNFLEWDQPEMQSSIPSESEVRATPQTKSPAAAAGSKALRVRALRCAFLAGWPCFEFAALQPISYGCRWCRESRLAAMSSPSIVSVFGSQ